MDQLFEIARKTFDTPEFRGITFIESEAKSIINRVPGGALPFDWTINPYRGCSHACTYCLWGDTSLLMADGRSKPIAKVEVGEQIYGTELRGRYRRYAVTEVLAHWSTMKPAYRVTLEDGTELIASGDHRFLTERGWKHVTGAEQGRDRRPFLTVNNALIGTGGFAPTPVEDEAYRRGYLTGMIRGDGLLASYEYRRRSGADGTVHRFRLALVDHDGLARTAQYLSLEGVSTTEFRFTAAAARYKEVHAIRTQRKGDIEAIRDLIAWPTTPGTSWHRGFLAGVFDAEGSCARDVIRISNTDPEILDRTATALDALEFAFVVEDPRRANGLKTLRLLGGLRERLAFLHTVDPAIARKRSIKGLALKGNAPLGVVEVEDLGLELPMYDITTGTGDFIADGVVSHNCFARPTHTYLDMNAGRDFETKIVVKVNAPDVLRRELAAKRWKGEHIAMGTPTATLGLAPHGRIPRHESSQLSGSILVPVLVESPRLRDESTLHPVEGLEHLDVLCRLGHRVVALRPVLLRRCGVQDDVLGRFHAIAPANVESSPRSHAAALRSEDRARVQGVQPPESGSPMRSPNRCSNSGIVSGRDSNP